MKKKITTVLALLTLVITCALYYAVNGNYTTYKIEHPPEGKHHAIIGLISTREKNGLEGNAFCSAFVIDDNRAMTAAHCVGNVKGHQDSPEFKKKLKAIENLQKQGEAELLKYSTCFTLDCLDYVKRLKESMAKLAETKEKLLTEGAHVFIIRNSYGEDTGIRGTAIYKSDLINRDHAIIEGNFKDFEKMPLKIGFDIERGDYLLSCGYPGGNTPPVCIKSTYINNYAFYLRAVGFMVKGMSGGPVVDKFGFAVGINSRTGDGFVFYDTMLGIFNFGNERPKK